MNSRSQVSQSNTSDARKWNFQSGAAFQQIQFAYDSLHQVMVLPTPTTLKAADLDTVVFQSGERGLRFVFLPHTYALLFKAAECTSTIRIDLMIDKARIVPLLQPLSLFG